MSTINSISRVLVIGASGALGSAVSEHLELSGISVVRASRRDGQDYLPVDLRDWASVKECIQNSGDINGVINAAGVVAFGSVTDLPQEVVREMYETNAMGVAAVLRYARDFIPTGGFVCNITGIAAEMDVIGMSAYCGSKAAAHRVMRVAKREFRSIGVKVIDARPSHTETGLSSRAIYGTAPKMPAGLRTSNVASLLVAGVLSGLEDMGPEYFSE